MWYPGFKLENPYRKSFLNWDFTIKDFNFPLWPIALILYIVVKTCIYASPD
jgi:hypothetical protein